MEKDVQVGGRYEAQLLEERVKEYWKQSDAYEKTKEHRAKGKPFFFVDGPPYTSGAAHMGTAWNKTLKDGYLRYNRMKGYQVYDRPGFDMHGLPIETKVEEKLGFKNKKDIEAFGIEKFIEECKEFADFQREGLQKDFISFGVWMDWENAYKTVTSEYMEAAWWGFSQAHKRGLVERGKRSISQCPRCETSIAKNEIEYHQVKDPSIYVKFELEDKEEFLVIWTTTPWTLPANTFVAVNEEFTYQKVVAVKGSVEEKLWIEQSLVDAVVEKGKYDSWEIEQELKGEDMIEWKYKHPLRQEVPNHVKGDRSLRVYSADFVEIDRTGLVHSAPGHGEDDFRAGKERGLELFCPVGTDGIYTTDAGKYEGKFVKDTNEEIIEDLKNSGLLLAEEKYTHDYGKCWRCNTNIIQIVTDQWFIKITEIKEELIENITKSSWYPEWAKDNRFNEFVKEAPDWNVSRQRYWGIPIPIWTPEGANLEEESKDMIVVGTREELAKLVDQKIDPKSVDLHKPTVDKLTITKNGKKYTRVPVVFDVWIDSSVATWATVGYPSEKEEFEAVWPANLIMEAHDQTRGWFWSQLGMSSASMGESPYENVLMHGWALAEDGRKMSKSLGNIVSPREAIEKYGADPMRLFLLSVNPQGEDMRFSWEEIEEMNRRLNILWNVFRFPIPYMEIDGFDPRDFTLEEVALETIDKWILSRLQTVKQIVKVGWESYRQDQSIDAILNLIVEDISRYYIKIVRERMWTDTDTDSKTAAYVTLHHVLVEAIVLLAPFAPFIAEDIYQNLTKKSENLTVHMCDFPVVDLQLQDEKLEDEIEIVRILEESIAHARQIAGRKLRWPVCGVEIGAKNDKIGKIVEKYKVLLSERVNAKEIKLIRPGEQGFDVKYSAIGHMNIIGPTYGKSTAEIIGVLNEIELEAPDIEELSKVLSKNLNKEISMTEEMVEFGEIFPENVAKSTCEFGVIYIDTTLTEEIESEGYTREVIRRVQEMRKEQGLVVDQEISVAISVLDERILRLIMLHEELIKQEVRATEITNKKEEGMKEWVVEGTPIEIKLATIV